MEFGRQNYIAFIGGCSGSVDMVISLFLHHNDCIEPPHLFWFQILQAILSLSSLLLLAC